jgi:hypothetical protein
VSNVTQVVFDKDTRTIQEIIERKWAVRTEADLPEYVANNIANYLLSEMDDEIDAHIEAEWEALVAFVEQLEVST